jgi:hypothetical protein
MVRIDRLAYRIVLTGGLLAGGLLAQPASADQTQITPGASNSPAVMPAATTAQPVAVPQSPAIGVPPMVFGYGTMQTLNWAGPIAPLESAMFDTFGRGR